MRLGHEKARRRDMATRKCHVSRPSRPLPKRSVTVRYLTVTSPYFWSGQAIWKKLNRQWRCVDACENLSWMRPLSARGVSDLLQSNKAQYQWADTFQKTVNSAAQRNFEPQGAETGPHGKRNGQAPNCHTRPPANDLDDRVRIRPRLSHPTASFGTTPDTAEYPSLNVAAWKP